MRKKKKKIDLISVRSRHADANKKLYRARHLYFALYYGDIVKTVSFGDKAEERMIQLGLHMRDHGLYAKATSRLALGKSVAGHLAREREKRYGDQTLWRVHHESRIPMAVSRLEDEVYA